MADAVAVAVAVVVVVAVVAWCGQQGGGDALTGTTHAVRNALVLCMAQSLARPLSPSQVENRHATPTDPQIHSINSWDESMYVSFWPADFLLHSSRFGVWKGGMLPTATAAAVGAAAVSVARSVVSGSRAGAAVAGVIAGSIALVAGGAYAWAPQVSSFDIMSSSALVGEEDAWDGPLDEMMPPFCSYFRRDRFLHGFVVCAVGKMQELRRTKRGTSRAAV